MSPSSGASRRGALGGVLASLLVAVAAGCGNDSTGITWETVEGVQYADTLDIDLATFTQTPDDPPVWFKDLVVGVGDSAVVGDTMFVHYTGWLRDGTQFDSNEGKDSFRFVFFNGATAIGGMHLGTRGQLVGGTRKIIMPPEWAYGGSAVGAIYAGAVLVFEVQLDSIHKPTP